MAVGSGLIATYSPITPLRKWIGYQIILGTGRGMGMQMVSCKSHPPFPKRRSHERKGEQAKLTVSHIHSH